MQPEPESRLKKVGMYVLGPVGLVALFVVCGLFLYGTVWVSAKAMPWLLTANRITFEICLFVFSPLCIFRKTRPWAGFGFYIASYVFGAVLFAFSCLTAYYLWGIAGLLAGLVFAGVGVLPVAMLASVLHGEWSALLLLAVLIIVVFGVRFLGIWLMTPTAEEGEKEEKTVVAA